MRQKIFAVMFLGLSVVLLASIAQAAPKFVDVQVMSDNEGNVTIEDFPQGATLVNVHVWNDCEGSPQRELGPKKSFKLKPCDGFNFLWKDSGGQVWYQLITPNSPAGGSLEIDDTWIGPNGKPHCKYIYRGRPKSPASPLKP